MASFMEKQGSHLAKIFAGVSVFAKRRKSKAKGKRGGNGGRGHKLKGFVQFTDVDEDKVARLSRRKQYVGKAMVSAQTPMVVWMRVVTDYGKTIMMNADQFEAGGAGNVASATPHFS